MVGTFFTHIVGWPLIGLNFRQQRFEADFRFNLVRVRENSEQIALLGGEKAETDRLLDRFGSVVANWLLIMSRTKRLTFLTTSYMQISIVFPFVVVSPAYFAGMLQLGGLMQTASAFNSVQTALSFFITAYRQIAEWRAVIERLDGFNLAAEKARAAATSKPVIEVVLGDAKGPVKIDDLLVRLPQGTPLVAADDIVVSPRRAGAGDRPVGLGQVDAVPCHRGEMAVRDRRRHGAERRQRDGLPQRPYFPIGTLAAAVTYPAEPGTFSDDQLADMITAVGLPGAGRPPRRGGALEPDAVARRAAAARHRARDPAGAGLSVARRGDRLARRAVGGRSLPALDRAATGTTIGSIGHRSTLIAFHTRGLKLARDGDHSRVRESKLETVNA